MTDAVIVAYGRSPIGRARKGSLVDVRPDDLAAHVVTKVLDKVPALDPTQIEDLICGCGLPGGEQGHNIGRVVSILARLDVPGVTVDAFRSPEQGLGLHRSLPRPDPSTCPRSNTKGCYELDYVVTRVG